MKGQLEVRPLIKDRDTFKSKMPGIHAKRRNTTCVRCNYKYPFAVHSTLNTDGRRYYGWCGKFHKLCDVCMWLRVCVRKKVKKQK